MCTQSTGRLSHGLEFVERADSTCGLEACCNLWTVPYKNEWGSKGETAVERLELCIRREYTMGIGMSEYTQC